MKPKFIPGPVVVSKEPQCKNCTHYLSEHLAKLEGHCNRVIGYFDSEDDMHGQIQGRQLCNCKEFQK